MKIHKKQNGFILIISLIVLLIMSLLVLYSMASSTNDEKMAGGNEDKTVAFQNAETGLRYAEAYIYNNNIPSNNFNSECTGGLCLQSSTSTPQWEVINWDTDTTKFISLPANTIPNTTAQPKFIIEFLGGVPTISGESIKLGSTNSVTGTGTGYRITVVAFGNRNGTVVKLQSVFVKR